MSRLVQSGAAYCLLGFEDENLGSSPGFLGHYCSYLLPKQTRGTTQILIFKTLRTIGRPTLYILEHGILPRSVSPTYITSANLHVLRLARALPLPLPRQRQINFAHRRLRRDLDNVGNHICGGIGGIGGD